MLSWNGRRARAALAVAGVGAALVAGVGFAVDSALDRNGDERVDAQLQLALADSTRALATEASAAGRRATDLARSYALQRAVAQRDRALARSALAAAPSSAAVYVDRSLLAGSPPGPALRRAVELTYRGTPIGTVIAYVPLDRSLLRLVSRHVRLNASTVLAIVSGGRVVAATGDLPPGPIDVPLGTARRLRLADASYRAVGVPLVRDSGRFVLAALEPVASGGGDRTRRILVATAATVATVLLLAAALASLVSGRRADRRERRRQLGGRTRGPRGEDAREALALVGDALAATHDPQALLPVILQAAVEATGAVGGRLVEGEVELARVGHPDAGGRRPLAIPLDEGRMGSQLLLAPPAGGFSEEARELGRWLGAQAAIALENARLHGLVKTQATTDELTGLANRRRFMEALTLELKRAERFGSPLALVLADLDDFKLVNDRFGHNVGDEVLRAVGDAFRRTLRDVDLPARLGGEEFAVLLPETDLEGAQELSERLRAAVSELELADPQGRPLQVTASFGIAVHPDVQSGDELLSAADTALYRAKGRGKNRVALAGRAG